MVVLCIILSSAWASDTSSAISSLLNLWFATHGGVGVPDDPLEALLACVNRMVGILAPFLASVTKAIVVSRTLCKNRYETLLVSLYE